MQIQIIAVGKVKEDYLKRGIEDYKKRLRKYTGIKILEVAEENIASRPEHEVKLKEAQKLLKYLPERDLWYVVALDRQGTEFSSEDLAQKIESLMIAGKSNIAFLIGGPLGLDESIIKFADLSLSLSKLTLPHQIARFVLLEQLYRSFKIIRGEPYHY